MVVDPNDKLVICREKISSRKWFVLSDFPKDLLENQIKIIEKIWFFLHLLSYNLENNWSIEWKIKVGNKDFIINLQCIKKLEEEIKKINDENT